MTDLPFQGFSSFLRHFSSFLHHLCDPRPYPYKLQIFHDQDDEGFPWILERHQHGHFLRLCWEFGVEVAMNLIVFLVVAVLNLVGVKKRMMGNHPWNNEALVPWL